MKKAAAFTLVIALSLTACSSSPTPSPEPPQNEPPTTSTAAPTTPPPTAPPSTPAPTTTTTQKPFDTAGFKAYQTTLQSKGFFVGSLDGQPGQLSTQATLAAQKYFGMKRTGKESDDLKAKLADLSRAQAPDFAPANGIAIDIKRQLIFFVKEGTVTWVFHTSTGKSSTPSDKGSFKSFRQVDAWDPGPNGALYRPKYYNGGEAIHGLRSVPAYPASHGCARVSLPAMDFIWSEGLMPTGTLVVVR